MRFDHVGERLYLVDERGELVHDDRALLVLLDLVAAERRYGRIAVPMTFTRVAEQVTRFHGVGAFFVPTAVDELAAAAALPDVVFAGDGHGGYVVPEFGTAVDGIAAFVRLTGMVARTQLRLSEIDARIPAAHVEHRSVASPWAVKGSVMRSVQRAAGTRRHRHHRRPARAGAGRTVGAGAAGPGGRGDPRVGGGPGPGVRAGAGDRVGPRGRRGGPRVRTP